MSASRDTANSTQGDTSAPGIIDACTNPYGGRIRENVSLYSSHFAKSGPGDKEEDYDYDNRLEKTKDIVHSYHTLATDFYEYGYGQAFHFAPVPDGKSFEECLRHYEEDIASTLGARPGMKILDIGCGVGGPAINIARFSGATVTGLNICDYQVERAREHTKKAGLQHLVSFLKGDFHKIDFPDNTFDGVYAIESTVHSKNPVDVYREVYRVLKPGALYVDSAWAMTDLYDPNNPEHVKLKSGIEFGGGIPEMRTIKRIMEAVKEGGLEIVGFRNCHHEGDKPWYVFLQGEGVCSLKNFRMSNVGRLTTHMMLNVMETLRIVPQGSTKLHSVLQVEADCLIATGKLDIFTPMFRIVARKPEAST